MLPVNVSRIHHVCILLTLHQACFEDLSELLQSSDHLSYNCQKALYLQTCQIVGKLGSMIHSYLYLGNNWSNIGFCLEFYQVMVGSSLGATNINTCIGNVDLSYRLLQSRLRATY